MRVLVTRPSAAAEGTIQRLTALGHEAIALPLMAARHDGEAARLAMAEPHAAIILTSAEAVRALAALTPLSPDQLSVPVFCVGAATARAAAKLGFHDLTTGEGNGQALAETMIRHFEVPPARPLLYLAGQPRSPDLEDALRAAHIAVRVAELYRMEPVDRASSDIEALLHGPQAPDVVLLYSRETARRFLALAPPRQFVSLYREARFLCLSPAIAALLTPWAASVSVASQPDEDSLFKLLPE